MDIYMGRTPRGERLPEETQRLTSIIANKVSGGCANESKGACQSNITRHRYEVFGNKKGHVRKRLIAPGKKKGG